MDITMNVDHYSMERAYAQFGSDPSEDELPIGAVMVWNNEIIGCGSNQARKLADPTQHAEMQAI
jgi:tRNA(Arg) A34 adenosine deaminase TadA